jgi:hypothetical protein
VSASPRFRGGSSFQQEKPRLNLECQLLRRSLAPFSAWAANAAWQIAGLVEQISYFVKSITADLTARHRMRGWARKLLGGPMPVARDRRTHW